METSRKAVGSVDDNSVAGVLSEIVDITSEALALPEIIGRVACSLRKLIVFQDMSVIRIVDGERACLYGPDRRAEVALSCWSPKWRPRSSPFRIGEARTELDPAFPMDAEALNSGLESGIWEPFPRGTDVLGGVWLSANITQAFDERHQEVLK